MRITLGNIDGKAHGLNASEACVYAAIEKCSRGDNAKGWYGTMQSLAEVLPFKVSRQSCMRSVDKLLNLGLILEEDQKLYVNVQNGQNNVQNGQNNVQNGQNNVQNGHENVQNGHENVQNELPPITPLYNNKENMKKEEMQQCTHTPARDAANQQPSGSDLINSFYSFRNAWLSAGGVTAEFERRSSSIWVEWKELTAIKRQIILDNLSRAIMAKRQPEHWKDNPLFFLRDYPEPVPTNYNGKPHPTGEPMVIAKYQGIGGVFTRREALLFNMTDLIDLDV